MLTASSSGVSAPMFVPIGECTLPKSLSPNPLAARDSYTLSRFRRLPIMPM